MYPQPSNSHRLCLGSPSSLGFCISPSTHWLLIGSCCLEGPLLVASNLGAGRPLLCSTLIHAMKQSPMAWVLVMHYRLPWPTKGYVWLLLPCMTIQCKLQLGTSLATYRKWGCSMFLQWQAILDLHPGKTFYLKKNWRCNKTQTWQNPEILSNKVPP